MLVVFLPCVACDGPRAIPIQEVRVEVCAATFECPECYSEWTVALPYKAWKELLGYDLAYGTQVSEREVETFARKARRFERELAAAGLAR